MRSGEAFNVVPGAGELLCDLRADDVDTFDAVLAGLPAASTACAWRPSLLRRWPGMDSREATAPLLAAAAERLGRPIRGADRGGASDASYLAPVIDVTSTGSVRAAAARTRRRRVHRGGSLRTRAEVALALADAVLA